MLNKLIALFSIATATMIYIMATTGAPLNTNATPAGILNAEFAYNTIKATIVYQTWQNEDILKAAYTNTYWDFVFLICYSGLMYLLCKFVYRKLRPSKWQHAAAVLSKLAFIAALLDIVENVFMFTIFNNSYSNVGLMVMFAASLIKWTIVFILIIYLSISLIKIGLQPNLNRL